MIVEGEELEELRSMAKIRRGPWSRSLWASLAFRWTVKQMGEVKPWAK